MKQNMNVVTGTDSAKMTSAPTENGKKVLTMDDYIRREDVIAWFMPYAHTGESIDADVVISDIKGIKAADVAPVVHGRWIHSRYEDCSEQFEFVKCSQCNHEAYAMAFYARSGNYCPHCGAKMME